MRYSAIVMMAILSLGLFGTMSEANASEGTSWVERYALDCDEDGSIEDTIGVNCTYEGEKVKLRAKCPRGSFIVKYECGRDPNWVEVEPEPRTIVVQAPPQIEKYPWFTELSYSYAGDGLHSPTLGIGRSFTLIGDLGLDLAIGFGLPVTNGGEWRQSFGASVFLNYQFTDMFNLAIGYAGQVGFGNFSFSRTDQKALAEIRLSPDSRFDIIIGGGLDVFMDTAQYEATFNTTYECHAGFRWYFN